MSSIPKKSTILKKALLSTSIVALLVTGCGSRQSEESVEAVADVLPSSAPLLVMEAASEASTLRRPTFYDANAPIQNTERYQHLEQNPVHSVASQPVSTFSVDVDTGSYANARRFLNEGRLPPFDAVRAEEFINYFEYAYPTPTDGKPFSVHSAVMDSPWHNGAKIIRLGIKAKEMSANAMPPANLVFLVDVSGSMSDANKLTLAKETLRILTQKLRPEDSITLITYANGEKLILPATKGTPQNKAKILRAINGLSASGSTAGEQAIQLAYQEAEANYIKDGINRVLLLTDGDFNVGITDFETLKNMVAQKRKTGVSLSTFGFGAGNYNEQLMEQLADAGDGNYSYIDTKNEAQKVLNRQLSSTLATVAQDVKVQVEFNPATVKEYRLIGYENRLLAEEDFNNDKVDAGDIGAGHTVTALYEIVPVGVQGWLNDSRYQSATDTKMSGRTTNAKTDEYAHVALRYKLPNQADSILITTPINKGSVAFAKADKDSQWAVLSASFAGMLKGGKYNGNMDYNTILTHAKAISEPDPYGIKAEFVSLVEIAQSLDSGKGDVGE